MAGKIISTKEVKSEEELLRERLIEIHNQKEKAEQEKRLAAIMAAYERCKDAQYILAKAEYPFYHTFRKISNVRMTGEILGSYPTINVDVHEEIRIYMRLRKDTAFKSKSNTIDTGATLEITDKIGFDNKFIQAADYPITEEEFNTAKNYAVAIIDLNKTFFKGKKD